MKPLIVLLLTMILLISCNQQGEPLTPYTDAKISYRSYDYSDLRQTLSNYNRIVKATSKWIATVNAREWVMDLKARRDHPLDEILLLQVLCSDEGDSFVQQYNAGYTTSTTKSALISDISTNAPFICIKIEAYMEQYVPMLDDYVPLIAEYDYLNVYMDGSTYDVAGVLDHTGGDLIGFFRVTWAYNTVLYDLGEKSFNPPLGFKVCDDLYDELENLGEQLCSSDEIPLSLSYDILQLFHEICGAPPIVMEICDNDIDDDGDDLVDCDDPDCCATQGCVCSGEEICNNSIDDDGDGLIDGNDPDCYENESPCMRDHYIEDNFFYELQLQSPQQLSGMGLNTCGGSVSLVNPMFPGVGFFDNIFGTITNNDEIEEWYDFLIKIHWGSDSDATGFFQDIVYRFNVFELSNLPEFTFEIVHAGQPGTGGGGGAIIFTVTEQGLTETFPVSLGPILFYAASDICGINNWDPGKLGDKVRISIHEFDNCSLNTTTGEVTTNTTTHTHTSELSLNIGLTANTQGDPPGVRTGGLLYKNATTLATTLTNSVSSSYSTNYANDYYLGAINYSYCWQDQMTQEQIHEIAFGNLIYLRMSSVICD